MPDPTGIGLLDQVLIWGGVLSVALGIGTGLWQAVRALIRFWRRMDQYLTDWYGEPERPGVPARPGVLVRLQHTERAVVAIGERLRRLEHEMRPNSGASLRDAVDLANCRLASLMPEGAPCPVPPEQENNGP